MIMRIKNKLQRKMRTARPWHLDICEYYKVTPEQAVTLGTRSTGRTPELPGSDTTHAVTGKTFEDIWESTERDNPAAIDSFWKDMGAWATFRQVYYHRESNFSFIEGSLKKGSRICEYGGGVGPVSNWIIENVRNRSLRLTLTDVPCEHLTFGQWRAQRLIKDMNAPIQFDALEILPNFLPLQEEYDVITILEVYEHLRNPMEATTHLEEHLAPGGLLWENYIKHDHPHASDLAIAQYERPKVFEFIRSRFTLISGGDPDNPDGGGTRCWRKL